MGIINTDDSPKFALVILISFITALLVNGLIFKDWTVSFFVIGFFAFILIPDWLFPLISWIINKNKKE